MLVAPGFFVRTEFINFQKDTVDAEVGQRARDEKGGEEFDEDASE